MGADLGQATMKTEFLQLRALSALPVAIPILFENASHAHCRIP